MEQKIHDLAGFSIDSVVSPGQKFYSYDEVAERLKKLISTAASVQQFEQWWLDLPEPVRAAIKNQVEALLTTLNGIIANRENEDWLKANYQNTLNEINARYDSLYEPFIEKARNYLSSQDATKSEVTSTLAQLKKALGETEDIQKAAGEATSDIASVELSKFFFTLAIGSPAQPTQEYVVKRRHKWVWWPVYQWGKFKAATGNLVLFNRGGYLAASRLWFAGTLISVAVTYIVARMFFSGNLSTLSLNELLAKAIVVGAPAYLIRFCVRNYNANRHLAVTNRHRAVVMQTVIAYLSRNGVTDTSKDSIMGEAAQHVFDPGETGYLTRRDGAGASDPVIGVPFIPGSK